MRYLLGIDGGGTKTRFLLAAQDGQLAAAYTGPTCHYLQCGCGGGTQVLREGIDACLRGAGAEPGQILAAFAACAGYGDVAADNPRIERAVALAAGGIPTAVGNDCENALAGALGEGAGIHLIAGTGSIGCARDEAGRFARCGGWHQLLGSDEGSGYWLALELLHEFTRQSDGRSARTALYGRVRSSLSLGEDSELITRVVEQWGMDRTRVASLSVLAGELAAEKDPFALALADRAAEELSQLALALDRRLALRHPAVCTYSGGVFRMGERLLAPLRGRLAAAGIALTRPLLQPDAGAVLLAARHAGLRPDPSFLRRLGASAAQPAP